MWCSYIGPSHGWASIGWPASTYLLQLCLDTGCSLEDLQDAIDDRDKWRERLLVGQHDDDNDDKPKQSATEN